MSGVGGAGLRRRTWQQLQAPLWARLQKLPLPPSWQGRHCHHWGGGVWGPNHLSFPLGLHHAHAQRLLQEV